MDSTVEAQLRALQDERKVVDALFDNECDDVSAVEKELRSRREAAWEARRVQLAEVDAKINALYTAATGAPIQPGDVVRATRKYGDLKQNMRGFVESFSHDGDHNIDQVSLTVQGGSLTVPRDLIVPELDADEADKFRLMYALRHLEVANGDYLHDIVRTAYSHLMLWAARLPKDAS